GKSSKEAACKPIQRVRHRRTVSTQMPNARAICELFRPWAAPKMMRPRRASCWAVPCRRTSASISLRSLSLKVSRSGLGPRMDCFLLLVGDLIILQTYFSRNVLASDNLLLSEVRKKVFEAMDDSIVPEVKAAETNAFLQQAKERIAIYAASSKAATTWKAYQADLRDFAFWCQSHEL